MVIRVSFSDNDFRSAIQEACEAIIQEVAEGYDGAELIELFKKYIDECGLENLRQRIVLAAIGRHIAFKGARGRFTEHNTTLATFDTTMHYIDDNVKVQLVEAVGSEWENGEVCYIDLFQNQVVVR